MKKIISRRMMSHSKLGGLFTEQWRRQEQMEKTKELRMKKVYRKKEKSPRIRRA